MVLDCPMATTVIVFWASRSPADGQRRTQRLPNKALQQTAAAFWFCAAQRPPGRRCWGWSFGGGGHHQRTPGTGVDPREAVRPSRPFTIIADLV